jgi:GTP-binding protein Era
MMSEVYDSIHDVDLVLHLVDASESLGKGEQFVLEMMKSAAPRKFLLLNKVDLINKGKLLPMIEFYSEQGIYDEIIPLSALTGENVDVLVTQMQRFLQEGEPPFPPDYLTNQNERQMVSEMIREKLLAHTRKELPYSTAVLIEVFDESRREEGFVRIMASILVEKDGQKKIVIGRAGQMIKQIGTEARKDIEALLEVERIYLELNVKVEPGWRNRGPLLDDLGLTLT